MTPRIRPGIFFVPQHGEGVLMDIVRDRYLGLDPLGATIWSSLCEGVSRDGGIRRVAAQQSLALATAERLWDDQLEAWESEQLIEDAPSMLGIDRVPICLLRGPATQEVSGERVQATRLSPANVTRYLAGIAWSRWARRARGIAWALQRLQCLPTHPTASVATTLPILRAYQFVRRIKRTDDDCLERSLALAWVLRRQKVDAYVCFGVQKFPFRAHVWVEYLGSVLNETLETTRDFAVMGRF